MYIMENVKTFCVVLDDFLNDLYQSYPDPSLFLLRQTTKAMAATNSRMLVENFTGFIKPYREKILAEDETFFLKGGLTNNIKNTQYSFLVDEINKISEIWNKKETTLKTKESIWKYFKVLIALGDKC